LCHGTRSHLGSSERETFNQIVVNTLLASVTNNFLWFALTFWADLEIRAVIATSVIGGTYMLLYAGQASSLEPLLTTTKRKTSMTLSRAASLTSQTKELARAPG
jgi:DHA3 family multidrug efflux protein-like MFS transporter